MSVARVVEISSTSTKSFEDAVVQGAYKVNLKVTFVLDGQAA